MTDKLQFCAKLTLVFLVFVTGCTPTLKTEYIDSPTYEVSGLKTWSWDTNQRITMIGILVGNSGDNIRSSLLSTTADELKNRGYELIEHGNNPDFLVSFLVGAANQYRTSEHRSNPSGLVQQPAIAWSQSNEYLEGGVSIILRNPTNDEIIWQGIARDKLSEREIRGMGKTTVIRLVHAIMNKFPESNR